MEQGSEALLLWEVALQELRVQVVQGDAINHLTEMKDVKQFHDHFAPCCCSQLALLQDGMTAELTATSALPVRKLEHSMALGSCGKLMMPSEGAVPRLCTPSETSLTLRPCHVFLETRHVPRINQNHLGSMFAILKPRLPVPSLVEILQPDFLCIPLTDPNER